MKRTDVEKIIKRIAPYGDRNLRDRALLETLFSTGLRISEALALHTTDFEWDTTDWMRETKELSIIGKGGRKRVVFFSTRCLKAIHAYLKARRVRESETRVFPVKVRNAQYIVKVRAKDAGLSSTLTPHSFRHSFATDLLQRGVNLLYVKEFLGHADISTTSRYLHTTNKELYDLHKKLHV